jgi:hypothetical protein
MLPHVPSILFHDYSTLVPPQILGLWLFPIPMCALGFLLTIEPDYDQIHVASSKSSHLFHGYLHGFALSTSPLAPRTKKRKKKTTQTFVIVTHNCQTLVILAHNS